MPVTWYILKSDERYVEGVAKPYKACTLDRSIDVKASSSVPIKYSFYQKLFKEKLEIEIIKS